MCTPWSNARGRRRDSLRSNWANPSRNTAERLRAWWDPCFEGRKATKRSRSCGGALSEMWFVRIAARSRFPTTFWTSNRALRWGFAGNLVRSRSWIAMVVKAFAGLRKRDVRCHRHRKTFCQRSPRILRDRRRHYTVFDIAASQSKKVEGPMASSFPNHSGRRPRSRTYFSQAIIDVSNGRVCCEFSLQDDAMAPDLIRHASPRLEAPEPTLTPWLSPTAVNFSLGANLMLFWWALRTGWTNCTWPYKQFQNINLAIKYAPKPGMAAPQGPRPLGGAAK